MSSPSSSTAESPPPRTPAFRVRSAFGGARRWRSRKNRPCDVCRRRKTACIIETAPPCLFCKSRSLPCESSLRSPPPKKRRREQPVPATRPVAVEMDDGLDNEGSSSTDDSSLLIRDMDQGGDDSSEHAALQGPESQSPTMSDPRGALPSPPTNASQRRMEPFGTQTPSPLPSTFIGDVVTFQDDGRRTAHSIGLAGEQDTNLLASLRSIIVNERNAIDAGVIQVFPGDPVCGEPPIHFNLVTDDLPAQDRVALVMASDAVEELVGRHGPHLVSLYFKYVHLTNCIVSKNRFLRAYRADKLTIPASLRGVVYGLGAMAWNCDPDCSSGPLVLDLHALFHRAHYSLHTENHAPNLWTLQASLLLLHERPGDNFTMETPRTWILSAQATANAQVLGLHREPKMWNIVPWEKHVRRKLWWATYVTDVWTSLCHGNPPHISNDSFTTSLIRIEDFLSDEEAEDDEGHFQSGAHASAYVVATARFVESVKLSRILHELLDSFFSDQAYKASISDAPTREAKLANIEKQLETWVLLRASCVSDASSNNAADPGNNGPLRLAYFAVKALLFRALMWPVTSAAKSDPESALRRFFDRALSEFEAFTEFVEGIDLHSLGCSWGPHARSQFVLCGNFLVYLFLMAPSSDRVQTTFHLLERVRAALKRLRDLTDNKDAIALFRPALLRMETLFTQAARIMDTQSSSPL